MKKCRFLNDFRMWLVTFAKTASLFFPAVFAAFEKRLMVKTVLHFETTEGEQNECLFKITVYNFVHQTTIFRGWAASFQIRRLRLTIWIRCVQASDESPDTSKFIELLDTLCPAKFHQIAELLERNTITRGRRHGDGSLAQKNKSWGWACDWRSWPQSGLKLDQLWRTRRVTHHCKRGKTKTISSHVNKFNTSH